jgi:hypothetical protein
MGCAFHVHIIHQLLVQGVLTSWRGSSHVNDHIHAPTGGADVLLLADVTHNHLSASNAALPYIEHTDVVTTCTRAGGECHHALHSAINAALTSMLRQQPLMHTLQLVRLRTIQ